MTEPRDHRIALPSGWRVWRWVELRSAGFHAGEVLRLAAPRSAAAADALIAARELVADARARVAAELARLPPSKPARRAAYRLEHGRRPEASEPELASLAGPVAELARAEDRARAVEAELAAIYEREDLEIGGVLCEIASDARLREALLWQNRHALHTGVDWLREHGAGPANRRRRQNQHLVASYLQRYCTKNDTIGFFGPFGFGEIAGDAAPLVVAPGASLIRRRTVYFEHWALDVLARKLAEDPAVRRGARPRRLPTLRLEGTTVHGPTRSVELPEHFARLLAELDGRRTGAEVARAVAARSHGELTEDDVLQMLDALAAKHLCTWTLELPTATVPPRRIEDELRALLAGVGPSGRRGLEILDQLDARRAAVGRAAGDVEQLDRALGELDACFEQVAEISATRRSGQTYAGRTIVYEECRRDVALAIGPGLLARLDETLRFLLAAGRWYTHHVACRYLELFERTFAELSPDGGPLPLVRFWQAVEPHFPPYPTPAPLVIEATRELQRRWAEVVPLPDGARRVACAPDELAARVERVFAAPGPGWPDARYHSPDVMIAAPSAEAVCRGEGLLVLGEFHPSVNTIQLVAQREHDEPQALIHARELDIPESVAAMVIDKDQATRGDHIWLSRQNVDIELSGTRSWRDRDQVLAVADLEVARDGARLVVRDRARRHAFDVVAFHGNYLTALIGPEFNLFAPRPHRPRVTVGDVVVGREQWRREAGDLAFAAMPRGPAQFAAARAWARANGIPRHVFVRIPEETKPIYVDFESPIYVELLAKLARKASVVIATEMLPGIADAWLPDAADRRYTCELRIIAVDPLPWSPLA